MTVAMERMIGERIRLELLVGVLARRRACGRSLLGSRRGVHVEYLGGAPQGLTTACRTLLWSREVLEPCNRSPKFGLTVPAHKVCGCRLSL